MAGREGGDKFRVQSGGSGSFLSQWWKGVGEAHMSKHERPKEGRMLESNQQGMCLTKSRAHACFQERIKF